MNEIDIAPKIGPVQMDVKQNPGKALPNIVRQIPSGSTIKTVISELTNEGHAIFTTRFGRFMLPASLHLQKGDKFEAVIIGNNTKLQAVLTMADTEAKVVDLLPIEAGTKNGLKKTAFEESVIKGSMPTIKKLERIEAEVKYINLSNINPKSALYKNVSIIARNDTMIFKLITGADIKIPLPPGQIIAEIVGYEGANKQLIKTDFGILAINETEFPSGKQLVLEIQTINSTPVMDVSIQAKVADALFLLGNHLPATQSLVSLMQRASPKKEGKDTEVKEPEVRESTLKKLLTPENQKALRAISEEFIGLKELLTVTPHVKNNDLLVSLPLNIFKQEEELEEEGEINIYSAGERLIRFTIDLNLQELGTMQLEGLVSFTENNSVDNFDLIFRSNSTLPSEIKNRITEIFSANKNITGIQGAVDFAQTEREALIGNL